MDADYLELLASDMESRAVSRGRSPRPRGAMADVQEQLARPFTRDELDRGGRPGREERDRRAQSGGYSGKPRRDGRDDRATRGKTPHKKGKKRRGR